MGVRKAPKSPRAAFRCRSHGTVAGVMLCPWDIALRGSRAPVMPGAQEALQQPASCLFMHQDGPRHLEREYWLAPCSQQRGVEVAGRRALPSRAALGVGCRSRCRLGGNEEMQKPELPQRSVPWHPEQSQLTGWLAACCAHLAFLLPPEVLLNLLRVRT